MIRLPAFLLALLLAFDAGAAARVVRVGLYSNPPKLFVDQAGKPAGILVDLLQAVAVREDWQLEFVRCQWQACLRALEEGRIDLLPDVALTEDRQRRFAFHSIPVLHTWSQIYRRSDVRIESVLDLRDKRVAVLEGSIQSEFLPVLLRNFGLNTKLVRTSTIAEASRLLDAGKVDAIAINQTFGDMQVARDRMAPTPILFQPARLYYAAAPASAGLLPAIDSHLAVWKANPDSLYYEVLERWRYAPDEDELPPLVEWALALALVLLAGALLAATWLRRQVRARTAELRDSEQRLHDILDSVESLIYIKDTQYRYRYVNGAISRHLGKPPTEILNKTDFDLFDHANASSMHEADRRVIERGERIETEDHIPGYGNDEALYLSTKLPLRRADGGAYGLCGISTDITERKKADESLRVAATVFQSQEGMFVLSPERRVIDVNHAYTAMTGWTVEELAGEVVPRFSLEPDGPDFSEAMWRIVAREHKWQGEVWTWRKDGSAYPARLSVTAVRDAQGRTTNYVGTQSDISQSREAQDRIVQLAYYDPLTRLPNRQLLHDRIEHCLSYNHRSSQLSALLFLDLDNFKDLNDTRGHAAGDALLQQVAERLLACARESDTVARLGGDEFVILLEGVGSGEEEAAVHAERVGWKLLEAVREPYTIGGQVHHSTCSIGIALCDGQAVRIDELMMRGDLAMYQAKKDGRNTVRLFHSDMASLVTYRASIDTELRTALAQRQFLLYYQGQVDANGKVTGAEALLRWRHPQRGLIGPAGFIGIAENSGLILPLGKWILEEACAQLARWAASPCLAHLTLAVNVSVRQFLQPDFVAQTLETVRSSGADPCRLKLELTESLMIERVEETIAKMHALKAEGIGFALDDFGTGYSSLSYLKQLPLDQLKIDRSFVRDVLDDPNDAAIASSVVALARSLNLAIIAEGVETEAQRAFLAEMGCGAWQGFLFSPPVEAYAFEQLVT